MADNGSHHGTGPEGVADNGSHHGTGPEGVADNGSHHGTGPEGVADNGSHHGTGPEGGSVPEIAAVGASDPIGRPPALPGDGSVPEIAFVGPSDAMGRVVGLVNALLAELGALSLGGAGRDVLRSLVAVLGRVRAGADAAEARTVTALEGLDDGGVDAVEVLRRNAGSSQREARRRRRRADALAQMPNVAGALAAGEISPEHADALARAAAATSAEAVDSDRELLAQVAGVPADRAGRHVQNWTQRHQDPADLHEQHLRQWRRRHLYFGDGDDGMLTAHAAFDRVLGAQFRSLINGIADRLWRVEGGRDNPNGRSAEQRRLDALAIAVGLQPAPAPGSRRRDGAGCRSGQHPRRGRRGAGRRGCDGRRGRGSAGRQQVHLQQQRRGATGGGDGAAPGGDRSTSSSNGAARGGGAVTGGGDGAAPGGNRSTSSSNGAARGGGAARAAGRVTGGGDGAAPGGNRSTSSSNGNGAARGGGAVTGGGDGAARANGSDRRRTHKSHAQPTNQSSAGSNIHDGGATPVGGGATPVGGGATSGARAARATHSQEHDARNGTGPTPNGNEPISCGTGATPGGTGATPGGTGATPGGTAARANGPDRRRTHKSQKSRANRRSAGGNIDDGGGRAVSARHQIVIVASADVVSGKDPQGRCEIPGIGPIPVSELERLACDAELFGVLFSGDGEPLWHGRGERTATDAQRRALLARDGVCVLCAAEPALCESHHIIPWAPPASGPTDIDNLALLCGTCHRRLHSHKRALVRRPDGAWSTQPDPRHAHPANRARPDTTTGRDPPGQ